jgi:hypothetical protein
MKRRSLLIGGATLALTGAGFTRHTHASSKALQALDESALIYITPLKAGGAESSCQAEVWFANQGSDIYVVTASDAWRARAIAGGSATRARVWVGDLGEWQDTNGRYRTLPVMEVVGSLETNKTVQAEALALLGNKYSNEWGTWGPRFRRGLQDGSRVMLKYQPLA